MNNKPNTIKNLISIFFFPYPFSIPSISYSSQCYLGVGILTVQANSNGGHCLLQVLFLSYYLQILNTHLPLSFLEALEWRLVQPIWPQMLLVQSNQMWASECEGKIWIFNCNVQFFMESNFVRTNVEALGTLCEYDLESLHSY